MNIKSLLPRRSVDQRLLARRDTQDPILTLQEEMNQLFDSFFDDGSGLHVVGDFSPRIDVSENDREVTVTAELPGMDENNIQVTLQDGVLSISGEKHTEKEDKSRRYHRLERTFGSFRRDLLVPAEVEEDKITATFKQGELVVVLPKSARAEVTGKKIPVLKG